LEYEELRAAPSCDGLDFGFRVVACALNTKPGRTLWRAS
jgi:hypothetical protein